MNTNAAKQESFGARTDGDASFTGLVLQDTYTVGPCIGRGGMGEVYEATHVRLPGRMAVKILRPHLVANEAAFARFCREAEIMSAVQHPHVIQIFDFNKSRDGLPYFVMEYLDGVDLEARLAASGSLPVATAVRIVDAVASALGAAHALGVVHRDLKPANIFLMRGEGQDADFVKVIDFGISKSPGSGRRLSNASDVIGTPPFMAPEQALGLVSKIDARTDQFALAAITYAMLTGHEPFVGSDPASLLYQVVHEPHPPLSRFVSWDTRNIQSVLDRALAKRQEERFGSIVEFARALAAAAGLATDGPSEFPLIDDEGPPIRRPVVETPKRPVVKTPRRPVVETPKLRLATPFNDVDLPRSVDRVPRGPQRSIVLAVVLMGAAGVVVHKGWYHGFAGHAVKMERNLVSLAREKLGMSRSQVSTLAPEATRRPLISREVPPAAAVVVPLVVPSPVAAESAPPAREPAAPDVTMAGEELPRTNEAVSPARVRHPHPHRPSVNRSGWQTIEIVPPAPVVPDGFSIPEPAPTPPARDLAPAPAPSE